MLDYQFYFPVRVRLINGDVIETDQFLTVTASIGLDERYGRRDWYIESFGIEGQMENPMVCKQDPLRPVEVHPIESRDPLHHELDRYVKDHLQDKINDKFLEWVREQPRPVARLSSGHAA